MTEMSPAEAVFFACLEQKTPEQRLAYLNQACAGQPELRATVEKLLAAHPRVGVFLESEPGPANTDFFAAQRKPATPSQSTEKEGTIVAGRYKLLQQIGEGGMGSVWMADQTEPVKRRVAVKLIRIDRGNTKMILSRFEAERQAIALMDHPHIARLLDAGTTDLGQPYFVMELVKGIPLTDYCDTHKLSIAERLGLFQQICSAVQHAHQKGIIHRDLKPTNILVESHDGKPVPKVIDFGLAKATSGMQLTEHTLFTAFGNVMGTPTYMAPEQATFNAVDVDTRADVYSLGVILYELLTGTTPITRETVKKAAIDEMLKLVREQEAPKPSSRLSTAGTTASVAANRGIDPGKLSKLLRGDLDWVVLKALEKDRKRRYETANGLAADIQRHLSNEPVIARPPSTIYRLQKAWQRNQLAFAAGTAIAASLVIGIAASLWQAVRADAEAKRAKSAEQQAVTVLDELRATAPAFAEQARALAAKEQYADAIAKLDYAIKLRPDGAEYLVAKGDLLRCQFQLAEAAAIYRDALRVQPGLARAEVSAQLCDELLAAQPGSDGKLSRESLAKLHLAMQHQQRPAAELMPVARLLGEEKKVLVAYWLERLKDLPISDEKPLAKRLTVREDGRLALDLSDTKVIDFSPLAGAPLATLDLSNCPYITDLTPLTGIDLLELNLRNTGVVDLSPLRAMHSLEELDLSHTKVHDLTPLQKLHLKGISLSWTRVTDLSPLLGMPIKSLNLTMTHLHDFSPLAQMPLERCVLADCGITDLAVLRGRPLKELSLAQFIYDDLTARNFAVLSEIKTLELLILPEDFHSLADEEFAAIAALRNHPRLRQIDVESDYSMDTDEHAIHRSKDAFWKDWDRAQTFLPALRKSGVQFSLHKAPDGDFELAMYDRLQALPLDLSMIQGAPISRLTIRSGKISDLTPLRGMPLKYLDAAHNPLSDLSPLQGMPLEELHLFATTVSDLAPLKGLPLKSLFLPSHRSASDIAALLEIPTLENLGVSHYARNLDLLRKLPNLKTLFFSQTYRNIRIPVEEFWKNWEHLAWIRALNDAGVDYLWDEDRIATQPNANPTALYIRSKDFSDCSIFRGADNITTLDLTGTAVTDLTPLRGLPLIGLQLGQTKVTDLSPIAESTTLRSLILPSNVKDIEFLRSFPKLEQIGYAEDASGAYRSMKTAAEFWKIHDAQFWLKSLRATGVAITVVNPLADGTWYLDLQGAAISDVSILKGMPISKLGIGFTAVTDLAPLKGLALKDLRIYGTKVTDLSPLQGMKLDVLHLGSTPVTDLSPLRGMPLVRVWMHGCKELTDLTPLADCQELRDLILPPNAKNLDCLRNHPKLERISYVEDAKNGYRPDKTVAEFWKDYDEQLRLR